ncbi:MAG: hypothetical protein Q4E74_06160 [Ruminococcus sp.]|nr:hypothetical protein [Ruminococcus sp.]
MNELKENFIKGWLEEEPRIVAASLLGILTFVILSVLLYKSEKRKKALKQQAIENKTAIQARIISSHRTHDSETETSYYGTYRYTLNGKDKEYSIHSNYPVPNIIYLYPKNSSATKFFSDYDRTVNAAIAFNVLASIAVHVFVLLIIKPAF